MPDAEYWHWPALLHSEPHWLSRPLGQEQGAQKHVVWWPKAVTNVEQKPAEEPVSTVQLLAMSTPALVAHVKWTRGVAALAPEAVAQTPLASTLPQVQAPLPAASSRLHRPGPHSMVTMPSWASHRTQVSPEQ
ncbi:hypothetical protein D7V97_07445 [Corallococcus sp. CA053C]|nr:hypothetical protein D7V97_07445 [Corallococcus sp. CA053C]